MYQYFDKNPDTTIYVRGKYKGKKKPHADCVVRAMMLAWDCDWREALTKLFEAGREIGAMPHEDDTWRLFCRKSTRRSPYIHSGSRCRKLLKELALETAGDTHGYIALTRRHLVFVKDGKYYDAWDSGDMAVSSIWEAE